MSEPDNELPLPTTKLNAARSLPVSFYRPLDHTKNEVRMLTIVDPSHGDNSGLVHCKLEHVSLDMSDFTPEFASFLSETNQPCNEVATRSWLENTNFEKAAAIFGRQNLA
jgi:hypothetical protein